MSFLEVTSFLFDGFWVSLLIFAVTLLCGAPLGLPIAFCSMSRFKVVKSISKVIVWIVRGVPLMLQIFIIYYVPGLLFQTPIFSQMDRFFFINYGVSDAGRIIAVLIAFSVLTLLYVGGFFTAGDTMGNFVDAFGNTDATVGLPMGGMIALAFTIVYMVCRRLITFKEAMSSIPKGLIAMVPAILILTMATALKNMTSLLGSDVFVETALAGASSLYSFLPAIIFVVACFIAFSTGTSWGTFGILIPIVLSVFPAGSELVVIGMSACLAGSVCGDHCSPISDTTIMSSAGAQCEHVNHVSTQLPYAITVAAVSFVAYLITGFVQNWVIMLPVSCVMLIATLFVLRSMTAKKA